MIKFALEYLNKWGFSVIPLLPNKRPLVKWEEYQKRKPTEKEIVHWWTKYPNSMIGIVTGKISGITVLDFDTDVGIDYTPAPIVQTPRGYHYYFKYEDGMTNTVNVCGEKIDIRGDGGYVVAPPSVNEDGKKYKWMRSPSIGLPKFPRTIFGEPKTVSEIPVSVDSNPHETFTEGRRDNDLFHIAHTLVKGGMLDDVLLYETVLRLASTCDPPFPLEEAKTKVESAVKRAIRKERPIQKEVEEWVLTSSGFFLASEVYNWLQVTSKEDKKIIAQALRRLMAKGVTERVGGRNACYRRIERECEEIDWQNAPTNDIPIKFPLDIHTLINIYPGNIIIVAGESNAGKTAFMLDFIRLNMDRYKIHYFNSEMGASELRLRLGLFKNVSEWTFTAYERADNFEDVIKPNDINVIDFLDVTDEFWKVGGVIKGIHEKLKDGICIIGLQKNEGYWDAKAQKWIDRDLGRGGALSLEKARLYLSMGRGTMKITKAKNWKGRDNPNRTTREFKLYSGSEFVPISFWSKP